MISSRSCAAISYSSICAAFFILVSSEAISSRFSRSVIFTPRSFAGAVDITEGVVKITHCYALGKSTAATRMTDGAITVAAGAQLYTYLLRQGQAFEQISKRLILSGNGPAGADRYTKGALIARPSGTTALDKERKNPLTQAIGRNGTRKERGLVVKRIASRLLIFFTALALLASCAPSDAPGGESGALTEEEFFKLIEESEKYGQKFDNLLMDETAAYFYGFSGASVSAMRLAVERLLWLKGEGDDFDSLTAGSRYTDWDEIAEICYASPYPYYFEGLIFDAQGKSEEAAKAYASAAVMGNYPEKGLSFRYLAGKSHSEALTALEKEAESDGT